MSLKLKYKSTHKASPLPSPTKVKGKVQRLCTQYCTFRTKIPIAAYDLAPQTETTTVCLAFCINPSSMSCIHTSSPFKFVRSSKFALQSTRPSFVLQSLFKFVLSSLSCRLHSKFILLSSFMVYPVVFIQGLSCPLQ